MLAETFDLALLLEGLSLKSLTSHVFLHDFGWTWEAVVARCRTPDGGPRGSTGALALARALNHVQNDDLV